MAERGQPNSQTSPEFDPAFDYLVHLYGLSEVIRLYSAAYQRHRGDAPVVDQDTIAALASGAAGICARPTATDLTFASSSRIPSSLSTYLSSDLSTQAHNDRAATSNAKVDLRDASRRQRTEIHCCPFCWKHLARPDSLKRHLNEICNRSQQWTCRRCPQHVPFTRQLRYWEHLRDNHGDQCHSRAKCHHIALESTVPSSTFRDRLACGICGLCFHDNEEYGPHLSEHWSGGKQDTDWGFERQLYSLLRDWVGGNDERKALYNKSGLTSWLDQQGEGCILNLGRLIHYLEQDASDEISSWLSILAGAPEQPASRDVGVLAGIDTNAEPGGHDYSAGQTRSTWFADDHRQLKSSGKMPVRRSMMENVGVSEQANATTSTHDWTTSPYQASDSGGTNLSNTGYVNPHLQHWDAYYEPSSLLNGMGSGVEHHNYANQFAGLSGWNSRRHDQSETNSHRAPLSPQAPSIGAGYQSQPSSLLSGARTSTLSYITDPVGSQESASSTRDMEREPDPLRTHAEPWSLVGGRKHRRVFARLSARLSGLPFGHGKGRKRSDSLALRC